MVHMFEQITIPFPVSKQTSQFDRLYLFVCVSLTLFFLLSYLPTYLPFLYLSFHFTHPRAPLLPPVFWQFGLLLEVTNGKKLYYTISIHSYPKGLTGLTPPNHPGLHLLSCRRTLRVVKKHFPKGPKWLRHPSDGLNCGGFLRVSCNLYLLRR